MLIRLFGPITQLLMIFDTVQSVLASLGRIVGVIDIPHTQVTAEAPAEHGVRVDRVTFGYADGPAVLHDIELVIPDGQHLGVVGSSGAGKTTLASLIAGIHEPRAGTVTRPDRTTVITQETHVFAGTLRENLTLAAPDATDEHLHTALAATSAGTLAGVFPSGLDTVVGATGHFLTPVQAQQIALARVVLADPTLAIFDEATAEAGSAHAEQLDRAATAALRGRTGLVIAHRLDQAAACDRIVVLEQGRITETGTHSELVAAGGVYAGLWDAWHRRGNSTGRTDPPGPAPNATIGFRTD